MRARWLCIVAALATADPATANAGDESPASRYDGLQQLFEHEAQTAAAAGDYGRAWYLYWRLAQIDPDDPRAQREIGRIAHALGHLRTAERALARAARLSGGAPDPELHYLRGEALLALGERPEGLFELSWAEAELDSTTDPRRALWRARIHALRGELDQALSIYRAELAAAVGVEERTAVMVLTAEAHMLARDWDGARGLLVRLVELRPDYARGRAMLAWVLEVRGELDAELAQRAVLARHAGDEPDPVIGYARALERSRDYPAALQQFRNAEAVGSDDVEPSIARLSARVAPEIASRLGMRHDPTGTTGYWVVGANVPVADWLRVIAIAGATRLEDATIDSHNLVGTASATVMIPIGRGGAIGGGALGWVDIEQQVRVGGRAFIRTSPTRPIQLFADLRAAEAWDDSAASVRETGTADSAEVQLSVNPGTARLVLAAAGRARRLRIAPGVDDSPTDARQLFGVLGVDVVVSASHDRAMRGEYFGDDLLWPHSVANAFVVSFRHYEVQTETPFQSRLALIPRNSLDELSATWRRVLANPGVLGFELAGGVGYDRIRELAQWRTTAAVLVSPTDTTRLSFDYEITSEAINGIVGRRQAASVSLHVDL